MLIRERLQQYYYLARFDKPVGTLLLLWPTLWALWLASKGLPHPRLLFIFTAGVILMRAAGCAINDTVDQRFDGQVKRTANRPLVNGSLSKYEAILISACLAFIAFLLVLQCNWLTIKLAVMGAGLAVIYPFLKRYTHLPQCWLGMAFSWGIPMAFAAQLGFIPFAAWLLFFSSMLWAVIYDTEYAMVDRNDDVQIGVKSTAILFGIWDKFIIGLLQILFIGLMVMVGKLFHLASFYYASLGLVAGLFIYQQWLIKDRDRDRCFQAFLNNNYIGLLLFIGVFLSI